MTALIPTFDFRLFWEGATDIFMTLIGTALLGAGHTLAFLGTLITIQDANLRKLSKDETAMLKRVFKTSLDYEVIQVHQGSTGFLNYSFTFPNFRPVALGNIMYFKRDRLTNELMVHECTHVWQYQNVGNRYSAHAIGAQISVNEPYNWEREINVRNKNDWLDLNGEAQAEFLEDLWANGELLDSSGSVIATGNVTFYDADWTSTFGRLEITHTNPDGTTTDRPYTNFARNAVDTVRAG